MDANLLINKLRANGTASDFYDLESLLEDYLLISKKIGSKDRPTFALNILCMLCRNIEKVPTWREKIDNKKLLEFSVLCLKNTKLCDDEQKAKVLACHYHLHKYIITQKLPSESVLQFSHMIFEECFRSYAKTYWAIIVDRLTFIEKYRKIKADISKTLPHMTMDLIKLMGLYEVGHFCREILSVAVKKMFYLYGDNYSNQLSDCFIQLLSALMDMDSKVKDEDCLEVFKKLNECSTVFIEIGLMSGKLTIEFLRKVYLKLFANKKEVLDIVNIYFVDLFNFDNLLTILRRAENFESKPDLLTINYFSNIVRLNIEHASNGEKWREISPNLQILLLKLILILMMKIVKCEQITKCELCPYKSSIHDSIRISFVAKVIITTSIHNDVDVKDMLEVNYDIIQVQNSIIRKLNENKCSNVKKLENKIQTNLHNLAILLYQKQYYIDSTRLFHFYLKNEFQDNYEHKNVTRALYNKSISELDSKSYSDALKSAYLSLIFSLPEGLDTKKYISLIIDIKSKAQIDELMTCTVLSFCANYEGSYGSLEHVFRDLDFCKLLEYEYCMYCKLWPSTPPISAIWMSYMDMYLGKYAFVNVDREVSLYLLMETILKSIDVVRTIHFNTFKSIINQLIGILEDKTANTVHKMFYATLLMLKSELDYAEASEQFDWAVLDKNKDPENIIINRTMSQEFDVISACLKGLNIWNNISNQVLEPSVMEWVPRCLPVLEFATQFLLHLAQIGHAMQLALINIKLAYKSNYMESYVKNACIIFYHSKMEIDAINNLLKDISSNLNIYIKTIDKETLFVCLCDAVLYLKSIGKENLATKLGIYVQEQLLNEHRINGVTYNMSLARLLEVFDVLCDSKAFTKLSNASNINKKWFSVSLTKNAWLSRRTRSLQIKYNCTLSTLYYTNICRHIMLWRRGRSAVSNAAGIAGASYTAELYSNITNTHKADDAQTKIENRLKYILYSTELKNETNFIIEKNNVELNSNKNEVIETMLRAKNITRSSNSPLSITTIPAFKMPEFLLHKNSCICYQCSDPNSLIIAFRIACLESSMYFRNKEIEIAKNYFEGSLKMINFLISKLEHYCQNLKKLNYEQFLIQIVRDVFFKKLIELNIELLIEYSFFQLSMNNVLKADDSIVQIHELLEENVSIKANVYLLDSFLNLLAASNKIKEKVPKNITNLEQEFEKMKISPKLKEIPKTPENKIRKPKPRENLKIKCEDEIPKLKLRIKKLDLENTSPNEDVKEIIKKKTETIEFKMPKSVKLQPEAITPRISRSNPKIILTQPSQDLECATPNNLDKTNFFTPINNSETPINEDKFFTPLSTPKTYTRKNLRQQIVKNLEKDFDIYHDSDNKTKSKVKTASSKLETTSTKVGKSISKLESTTTKVRTSSSKLESATTKIGTSSSKLESASTKVKTSIPRLETSNVSVKSENSRFNTTYLSCKSETSSSKHESASSKLEPSSSKVAPTSSKLEPASSKFEPASSTLEARRSTRDRRTLRRATSPGKLPNESNKTIKRK